MKKYDIISLGEALIDYIPTQNMAAGNYKASVGGAPLNVAIGAAKLGARTANISCVGRDPLGAEIVRTLQDYGVDCGLMQTSDQSHTSVTIVMPQNADAQRYLIYRGADCQIDYSPIDEELLRQTHVLHVGTLLNVLPEAPGKILAIIRCARASGVTVSYDVNMRPGCWRRHEEMIWQSRLMAQQADIIKVTAEERELMALDVGTCTAAGKTVLITDGASDIQAYWKREFFRVPVTAVKAVDVTGAGDAFMAGFLYQYTALLNRGEQITKQAFLRCVETGMRSGSFSVQKTGAHSSYPSCTDIL